MTTTQPCAFAPSPMENEKNVYSQWASSKIPPVNRARESTQPVPINRARFPHLQPLLGTGNFHAARLMSSTAKQYPPAPSCPFWGQPTQKHIQTIPATRSLHFHTLLAQTRPSGCDLHMSVQLTLACTACAEPVLKNPCI